MCVRLAPFCRPGFLAVVFCCYCCGGVFYFSCRPIFLLLLLSGLYSHSFREWVGLLLLLLWKISHQTSSSLIVFVFGFFLHYSLTSLHFQLHKNSFRKIHTHYHQVIFKSYWSPSDYEILKSCMCTTSCLLNNVFFNFLMLSSNKKKKKKMLKK